VNFRSNLFTFALHLGDMMAYISHRIEILSKLGVYVPIYYLAIFNINIFLKLLVIPCTMKRGK